MSKKAVDPARFQGDGVSFRGKIIGVMDVPELKGDKMCFDSMQKLKSDVLHRGEHKQRIFINVGFDGIKVRKNDNDKADEILHHHEIKCISFIWRDPTDARAFGYVTAQSVDTKKQFIAIKTERAADQVIASLKELFQAIIEAKQKESANGQAAQEQTTPSSDVPTAAASDATNNQAEPTSAVAQPAQEEVDMAASLFSDWPVQDAAKKEENFIEMLLAPPPPPQPRRPSFVEQQIQFTLAPTANSPVNAWNVQAQPQTFSAPPIGLTAPTVPPRVVPTVAAAPPGVINAPYMPYQQPIMPNAYAALNVGPTFTTVPQMIAVPANAAYNAYVPPYQQPIAAPPTAYSAQPWQTQAPPANVQVATSVQNPFAVERGSAASVTQQPSVFSGGQKKEAPFFLDLVAAGKERYGVWPDSTNAKPVERPKALHELIAARQPLTPAQAQTQTQTQSAALQAPLGMTNSIAGAGNSLMD